MGGGRRALRSPGAQRARRLARGARRRRTRPSRRRRQRVGHGRRAGDRRRAGEAADAAAPPARRLLERRGDRPARVGRLHRRRRRCRSDRARRLSQLRHGRPHAGQQARGAGDGHQHGVGVDSRARQRGRRLRPHGAGGSVPADRRDELQPGGRAEPVVHDRRAHRLPQAVGHRRQDRVRRSRSRGRLRRRHRAAA